jgi:hypothetical protein
MPTFEDAFSGTENAAASVMKAANSLTSLARQMHRAAQDGNIGNMKRSAERMSNAVSVVRQEVDNATKAWPFDDNEEEQYLRESYTDELIKIAAQRNLRIHERDGRLISHPSVVRVLAGERAIRIDRRRVTTIRPAKLVSILLNNQQRRPRFRPEPFLDALYKAYLILIGRERSGRLVNDRESGPVIPLLRVYEVFTSLPGSNREYDRTDFARDLYFLESSDIRQVKSGARVSFPASTGTRRATGTLSFVGPDGELIPYYGIQFNGGSR